MWFALTSNDKPCCDLDFDGRWWIVVGTEALLAEIRSFVPIHIEATPFSGTAMEEELVCRCLLDEVDGLVVWSQADGEYSKVLMHPPLLGLNWQGPALA